MFVATAVRADTFDTVNFLFNFINQRDNNLFRLANGVSPQAALGTNTKADTVKITQLGLMVDKTYSLQRFKLNVTQSDYRYNTFSYLNFKANDYSLAWLWALTPNITGTISKDRSTTLNSYTDYNNYTQRNLHTVENRRFDIDGNVSGSWHLTAAATQYRQKNSQFTSTDGDYVQDNSEVGVKYVLPKGSSVALVERHGRGKYSDRIPNPFSLTDNEFKQNEHELRLDLNLSARSNLKVTARQMHRKYQHFAARDYKGPAGRAEYNLTITDKTRLTVFTSRDLNDYQTLTSSFYKLKTTGISPSWSITPKLALVATLQQSQRDYRGSLIPGFPNRIDKVNSASLGLNWAPTDKVTIVPSVQTERRRSSFPGLNYSDRTVGVTAQLVF